MSRVFTQTVLRITAPEKKQVNKPTAMKTWHGPQILIHVLAIATFSAKNLNSAAQLKILWTTENCGPYLYIINFLNGLSDISQFYYLLKNIFNCCSFASRHVTINKQTR